MIRVLLVDDEYLLREHIRNTISWTELGMEVVGEARDGVQALEAVASLAPDIVLTDISMPNMDGVSLCKALRKRYPDICILIITGYGEFAYAQEAIKAGVFHYLLKPIDREEYTQALLAARDEVFRRRGQNRISAEASQYQTAKRKQLCLKKLLGDSTGENTANMLKDAGFQLSDTAMVVIIARWESLTVSMGDQGRLEACNREIQRQFQQLSSQEYMDVVEFGADEFVILANMDEEQAGTAARRVCQLCDQLEEQLLVKLHVGISEVGNGFADLTELYRQARQALKEIFVQTGCRVSVYNRQANTGARFSHYVDSGELIINLRQGAKEDVRHQIEVAFADMVRDKADKEGIVFTSLLFLSVLDDFLAENNRNIGYESGQLIDVVSSKRSVAELKAFLLMLFEKSIEEVFFEANRIRHEKVELAKQYILEHYADKDLSLNSVAAELFVNASYLSSLFKKEMSVSMMEYINQTRLNQAKKRLDHGQDETIYDIASAVGYNNEYYFMRCFKKQFGVSPKNYLKMKGQRE